jgi:hypothetical protein
MKVLLVTIAIGDRYLQIYNYLFRKSQEAYAKKYGYDFKVITEFLDNRLHHPSTISFNKILVCSQDWSSQYDIIIFVDADILINNNAPPLHLYKDYETKIGIADEWSQPTFERRTALQKSMGWETTASEYYKISNLIIETNTVLNTGVLVLQPKYHRVFLEDIYYKYVKNAIGNSRGFHFEQSAIGYELQKANMFTIISNEFNALWGLVKTEKQNTKMLDEFFQENHFIHFAGQVDFDKVYPLYMKHITS